MLAVKGLLADDNEKLRVEGRWEAMLNKEEARQT